MKRSVTYSVLAAAIFSALSFPAFAADNADSNVTTKDVIVTATRTEQEVKNVPNTVEVITQEDIQRMGATDVYSALRLADNIYIKGSSDGFERKISIRGMETNQALFLINGRRIAAEDTPTAQNGMTLSRLNVSNIERIEIVRGAASAQYGSDALSGVINIITKKSGDKPSVTVGANTSNESMNNYYHIDLGQQGNFSGTVDLNFGKDRARLVPDGSMEVLNGPKQNYNFSGTWDFSKNRSLTFDAGYYKSNQSADWGDSMQSMLDAMTGSLSPAMKDRVLKQLDGVDYKTAKLKSKQRDFSLTYNGKTDVHDFSLRAYHTQLDKSRILPYGYILSAFSSAFGGQKAKVEEENKYSIWGFDGHDSIAIGDNHLLTIGGEYTKNKLEGDNIRVDGEAKAKDTTTYAAYLQDEWMINDKLLLIPAIRYDHHSDFGNKTTPKIGATYFINNNNRLKANWGKGFKAPTVSDLYMDYSHAGSTILGNPDLRPEESKSWDVSYEYDKGGTFAKLTYFNNDVDNMISTYTVSKSISKYYNIPGTTKTDGVEFTLGRHFNPNWTVKLHSDWTNAENNTVSAGTSTTSPHSVDGIADNITTIELNYDDNKVDGFGLSLWNQWYTNYYDSSSKQSYSYQTTNFVINKKLGEGRRVFVGVDNIFDKKIVDINLDGRIWRVGAEWKI